MQGNQMTAEEAQALLAERDRLQAERDAAVNRADAEGRRAETLQGQVLNSGRQLATAAVQNFQAQENQADATVNSLTTQLASLQAQRRSLLEEGKFEEEGEINIKIAEAVAARQQAIQAKQYYGQQRAQAAARPADPVEQFLQTREFGADEADWIRRNPRYATDQGFQQRVNAAHAEAVKKSAQGSPEYFKALEDAGYMRQAAQPQPEPRRTTTATEQNPDDVSGDDGGESPYSEAAQGDNMHQQRQAPRAAAATPSRRSPTAPTVNGRQVVADLTSDQMELAMRMAESGAAPDDVLAGGVPAISKWWHDMNTSQAAARKREEWAA